MTKAGFITQSAVIILNACRKRGSPDAVCMSVLFRRNRPLGLSQPCTAPSVIHRHSHTHAQCRHSHIKIFIAGTSLCVQRGGKQVLRKKGVAA